MVFVVGLSMLQYSLVRRSSHQIVRLPMPLLVHG
jgi:hypothetical protein